MEIYFPALFVSALRQLIMIDAEELSIIHFSIIH